MDSFKEPGVILAGVDLLAITCSWVYIQRQIEDLKKQIKSLPSEDKTTSEDADSRFEEIGKHIDNLDKGVRYLVKLNKHHETVISSFDERLRKLEKNKIRDKGDKPSVSVGNLPLFVEPALPPPIKDEIPKVKLRVQKTQEAKKSTPKVSTPVKESDDEDWESSSEEEDEMSYIVSLAKKKANEKSLK